MRARRCLIWFALRLKEPVGESEHEQRSCTTRCLLVLCALLLRDGLPHQCETLIKSEFLPYFKSFLATQSSALDETVNTTMSVAILETLLVKPARITVNNDYASLTLTYVCSTLTSSSKSKSMIKVVDVGRCRRCLRARC